jgi:hypothetical protein
MKKLPKHLENSGLSFKEELFSIGKDAAKGYKQLGKPFKQDMDEFNRDVKHDIKQVGRLATSGFSYQLQRSQKLGSIKEEMKQMSDGTLVGVCLFLSIYTVTNTWTHMLDG